VVGNIVWRCGKTTTKSQYNIHIGIAWFMVLRSLPSRQSVLAAKRKQMNPQSRVLSRVDLTNIKDKILQWHQDEINIQSRANQSPNLKKEIEGCHVGRPKPNANSGTGFYCGGLGAGRLSPAPHKDEPLLRTCAVRSSPALRWT
jgi:hypothetical protein